MKSPRFFSAILITLSTFNAQAEESDYNQGIKEIRTYCMAEVCLGMSIKEVSDLPGGRLEMWNTAKGTRNCSGSYAEWDYSHYTTRDGVRLSVGFRDFPGTEPATTRYRVQSISTSLEATEDELREISRTLRSRYKMRYPSIINQTREEWNVSTTFFDVSLHVFYSQPPKNSSLILSAKADTYPEWLRSQPSCSKAKPPLPKL